MSDALAAVIPASLGLIGGIVGSLIAPWIHWGIEKKKIRLEARRIFIREVRELLSKPPEPEHLLNHPLYAQLRPYLSEKTRKFIEADDIIVVQRGGRGNGINNYVPAVLDEIGKLEKKWGLL